MNQILKILTGHFVFVTLTLNHIFAAEVVLRTKQKPSRYITVEDENDVKSLYFTKNREDAHTFVIKQPGLNDKEQFVSIMSTDGDMFVRANSDGYFTLSSLKNKKAFRRAASFKKKDNKFLENSVSFISHSAYLGNHKEKLRVYTEDEAGSHKKAISFEIIATQDSSIDTTTKATEKPELKKWTSCSQTCGKGSQQLIQNCPTMCEPVYRECNLRDCFVQKKGWTKCSKSCGGGVSTSLICRGARCRNAKRRCNLHPCDEISQKVEMCTNNPCVEGKCGEVVGGYICKCDTLYIGDHCDIKETNQCDPNPCENDGSCFGRDKDFSCTCLEGFTGKKCDIVIDHCEDQPCKNEGTCTDSPIGFLCECRIGYTGQTCSKVIDRCNTDPCQNGGKCSSSDVDFSCTCPDGFRGVFCEEEINQCDPNPCENDGSCFNSARDFACTCLEGFTGKTCDIVIDHCEDRPCKNEGTCTNSPIGFLCECRIGYAGPTCSVVIDRCNPDPCQNDGKCSSSEVDFSCTCADGYMGGLCEEVVDRCNPNPCQNNGKCSSSDVDITCTCPDGFMGIFCGEVTQNDACSPSPCQNKGACVSVGSDYRCICATGFKGANCENLEEWDVSSECTRTCGGGSRYKIPKCESDDITICPRVYETCNSQKCPDASCDFGSGKRSKYKLKSECCTLPPAQQECGVTNFDPITRRIIGGYNAQRGQWPWATLLHIATSPYSNSTCGGALIHKRWLITAAHCLEGVDESRVVATLGTTNPNLGYESIQTRKIEKIIRHPSYLFPTGDITLLKLDTDVTLTTYVRPICLPMGERPSDDSKCFAAGWGIARVEDIEIGLSSDDLMEVGLNKLNLKVCLNGYAGTSTGQLIDTKMLCAGSIDGGVDTCMGDSGGPLMCQRCDSCAWYLAGITSFGAAYCGQPGLPGIYTDVVQYEEWIKSYVDVDLKSHKCSL